MFQSSQYGVRTLGVLVRVALVGISLAMLLSFPFEAGHQFVNHLRSARISQQIKRRTSVGQPEADCARQLSRPAMNPIEPVETPIVETSERSLETEIPSDEHSTERFMLRLRLGSPERDSSPPLLQ